VNLFKLLRYFLLKTTFEDSINLKQLKNFLCAIQYRFKINEDDDQQIREEK
jgi:hypothetical protein